MKSPEKRYLGQYTDILKPSSFPEFMRKNVTDDWFGLITG